MWKIIQHKFRFGKSTSVFAIFHRIAVIAAALYRTLSICTRFKCLFLCFKKSQLFKTPSQYLSHFCKNPNKFGQMPWKIWTCWFNLWKKYLLTEAYYASIFSWPAILDLTFPISLSMCLYQILSADFEFLDITFRYIRYNTGHHQQTRHQTRHWEYH